MTMREDETFVYGRTREMAQACLAACRELGMDPHLVKATDSGFIVPDDVWAEVKRTQHTEWAAEEAVF